MARTKGKKKTPMRMCVACRQMKPKQELIRVVRTPEGNVLIDDVGKKSGRGAYLCYNDKCLEKAVAQNRLGNALRCTIPPEFISDLRGRMVN